MNRSRALPIITLAVCVLCGNPLRADENKEGFSTESEASVVTVSGNANSETYAAKSLARVKDDANTYSLKGFYLDSRVDGSADLRAWNLTGKFERQFTSVWAGYGAYGSESDISSGYVQRDNSDVGAKYYLIKSEPLDWTAEAGYRYTKTEPVGGAALHQNFGRVYTEVRRTLRSDLLGRLWVEYLPNFSDPNAYQINTEPSLTVTLNQTFSMKTAYLFKYDNGTPAPLKKSQAYFTTSLVAKF